MLPPMIGRNLDHLLTAQGSFKPVKVLIYIDKGSLAACVFLDFVAFSGVQCLRRSVCQLSGRG
jgi:hypothetical protein